MLLIEASDVSGASFDRVVDNSNPVPSPKSQDETATSEEDATDLGERGFLLNLMRKNGLVEGEFTYDDITHLQLTYSGHVWLQDYRRNTAPRRLYRWIGRQFDKVFSSILLPVIAAILTVVLMNFLGISAKEFDQ